MSDILSPFMTRQIAAAYSAGYKKCLEDRGELKPYISLSAAHKKYGRDTVNRWVAEGLIEIIKDGARNCRCRILRERLEMVAASCNRTSWYDHNEK